MDLLLTGATGALGAELLRRLVQERPGSRIYVLLRADSEEELRIRALSLRSSPAVIPLRGDVALNDLGLGDRYHGLAGRMGEIYHAAASTRFDQPPGHASRNNLLGTRNVLEFARAARQAGNFGRLHYVSTVYVSGRRTGCMKEDELDCGQQFFNSYEWSKFEAERAVRAAGHQLPVTIYRPSVVVGDSRTGCSRRFLGIYQVLRWIDRGLVDTLPCRRDFQLDVIPVDYVADAIVRLAGLPESVGRTFHVTAGSRNTLAVEELLEIFLRQRPVSASRLKPLQFAPPLCEPRTEPPGSRMRHYIPYLTCAKSFDDQNARSMLHGLPVPPCRDYFSAVARYALETGFRSI